MKSHLFFVAALFTLAASQQAAVPADLAESFSSSGTQGLQVSFGGDASEGITNGNTVGLGDVSNQPTFALGDSSGVNRAISYTILMLDTTDNNARKVQFLQSGFKATGDKTKLEAEGEPAVPYAPPSLDSGPRQFSFLLYQQRGQELAQLSGVPINGAGAAEPFDVKAFEAANNLRPARVGMAIIVDGNAGEAGQGSPSLESTPVFVPSVTQGTLPSASASTSATAFIFPPLASTIPSTRTAAAADESVARFSSPFAFTSIPAAAFPSPLPSPPRLDSPSSSELSLTGSPSTTTSASPSAFPFATQATSASPSPFIRQTRTSTVIVMASPTSTPVSSTDELVGAAAEVVSGNSAAAGLYGSAYSGIYAAAVLLLAQAGWYTLAL